MTKGIAGAVRTREVVDIAEGVVRLQQLTAKEVEKVGYRIEKVPASDTDWSFMVSKRVQYTYTEKVPVWVTIETRELTEEEGWAALDSELDSSTFDDIPFEDLF